ncbi:MAG: hypothetical protein WKF70_15300, partial [Chitinophagaceae bacterium]
NTEPVVSLTSTDKNASCDNEVQSERAKAGVSPSATSSWPAPGFRNITLLHLTQITSGKAFGGWEPLGENSSVVISFALMIVKNSGPIRAG